MNSDRAWKPAAFLFLFSQALSLFGSMLVQYAILWYITLNAQSGVMQTLMILMGFIPTFLISPLAGVWADRYSRKILIILSDALVALTTLILALISSRGFEGYWPLLGASFLRALGQGIQTPAVGAVLPQLVPREELTRFNGIFGTIQSLTMLMAPIAAGALMSLSALTELFYIDVVTGFTAIIILIFFIRIPDYKRSADIKNSGFISEFLEGIGYIKKRSFLKQFFFFSGLFMFLAAPVAFLSPLQVARSFGEDV